MVHPLVYNFDSIYIPDILEIVRFDGRFATFESHGSQTLRTSPVALAEVFIIPCREWYCQTRNMSAAWPCDCQIYPHRDWSQASPSTREMDVGSRRHSTTDWSQASPSNGSKMVYSSALRCSASDPHCEAIVWWWRWCILLMLLSTKSASFPWWWHVLHDDDAPVLVLMMPPHAIVQHSVIPLTYSSNSQCPSQPIPPCMEPCRFQMSVV